MSTQRIFGGDDDTDQTPDPVIDAKNIGEDGVKIGEGHDPIEDEVL